MEPGQMTDWATWLVPVLASWLISQWQRLGSWLKPKANWIKIGVYILIVAVGMALLALLKWVTNSWPADWHNVFWNSLLGGIAGTIIYKIGHRDAES